MNLRSRCCDDWLCNLNSLILRCLFCYNWVRNLNLLICIYMSTTEGLFNSNNDTIIKLVKLWKSYYWYWMTYERSTFNSDIYIFPVMFTYFWCRPLYFCVMSIFRLLWMIGATILFWVHTWCILFITSVRRSDVEHLGSWRLEFLPLSSWLILVIVIPSPWLMHIASYLHHVNNVIYISLCINPVQPCQNFIIEFFLCMWNINYSSNTPHYME